MSQEVKKFRVLDQIVNDRPLDAESVTRCGDSGCADTDSGCAPGCGNGNSCHDACNCWTQDVDYTDDDYLGRWDRWYC